MYGRRLKFQDRQIVVIFAKEERLIVFGDGELIDIEIYFAILKQQSMKGKQVDGDVGNKKNIMKDDWIFKELKRNQSFSFDGQGINTAAGINHASVGFV